MKAIKMNDYVASEVCAAERLYIKRENDAFKKFAEEVDNQIAEKVAALEMAVARYDNCNVHPPEQLHCVEGRWCVCNEQCGNKMFSEP